MKILLTGATGFVGQAVLTCLLHHGHQVHCLVRRPNALPPTHGALAFAGDVLDDTSLDRAAAGCQAAIHLVGIIRQYPQQNITYQRLHVEASRRVLAAAQRAGIRRYLHMSANGARSGSPSGYCDSKGRAEELVRQSALDWTIFRPSLIYGRQGAFTRMLAQQVRLLPAVPVIGDGRYPLAPVAVDDIAGAFVSALEQPDSHGQTYPCCGPDRLSYNELIDAVALALGKKPPLKLHQPASLMRWLSRPLQHLSFYPVTVEQIDLLLAGNCCDDQRWCDTFALQPTSLTNGLHQSLEDFPWH